MYKFKRSFWEEDTFFDSDSWNWGIKYLPAFDKLLHFQLFGLAMLVSVLIHLAISMPDYWINILVGRWAIAWSLVGVGYELIWQKLVKKIKPSWRDLVANEVSIGLHSVIIVAYYNVIN